MSGCTGDPNKVAPDRETREQWERERANHGEMGLEANMDLLGSPFLIMGQTRGVELPESFTVHVAPVFPNDGHYVYATGSVSGVGSGLIILDGPMLTLASAQAAAVDLDQVEVDNGVRIEPTRPDSRLEKPDYEIPQSWADANESFFFARDSSLRFDEATVSGFDQGVLIESSGASTALQAPLELKPQAFWWDHETHLEVDSLEASFATFALGGNVESGAVDAGSGGRWEKPRGVFGLELELSAAAGRVQSLEPFRLTQVLTDDGYQLGADVEVLPSGTQAVVTEGETGWFSVSFRESSYVGDGVLKDVRVTGPGADLIQVPTEEPPWWIVQLWDAFFDAYEEAPWVAAFVALPLALVTPFILLLEAFASIGCAFSVCPEKYPYPLWMDAGQVGVFYLKLSGDADPGSYPATIHIEGHNYEAMQFDVDVVVEAPSSTSTRHNA